MINNYKIQPITHKSSVNNHKQLKIKLRMKRPKKGLFAEMLENKLKNKRTN